MKHCTFLFATFFLYQATSAASPPKWVQLASGIEYSTFQLTQQPEHGDGILHVVRIDPRLAKLRALLSTEQKLSSLTAEEWARRMNCIATINAGMFQQDMVSNVGFLKNGSHHNNPRWNKYQSAIGFNPADAGSAPLAFVDLDEPDAKNSLNIYDTVIQNLRLIKGSQVNVWAKTQRRWSESAVAADEKKRLLFLFTRTPLTMHEFNTLVLALPLQITRAMHVEGGPESSLSIRSKTINLNLAGSFETGFTENNSNSVQWALPNVICASAK